MSLDRSLRAGTSVLVRAEAPGPSITRNKHEQRPERFLPTSGSNAENQIQFQMGGLDSPGAHLHEFGGIVHDICHATHGDGVQPQNRPRIVGRDKLHLLCSDWSKYFIPLDGMKCLAHLICRIDICHARILGLR